MLEQHFTIYGEYGVFEIKPNPDGDGYKDGAYLRYEERDNGKPVGKPIELWIAPDDIRDLAQALIMASILHDREAK